MNQSKIGYKVASWAFVIVGVGHSSTYFFSPKNSEQLHFMEKMQDFSVPLLNKDVSILSLHQGFAIMMGLLLASYGLINLIINKNSNSDNPPSNLLILNILVSLLSVTLSVMYFFIVPVVLTGLAFIGFTFSYISRKQ